ncbi:hypothetical protein VD0002_g2681 [Verticillium dahliae]|uniref:Rhodopsin domain-containing protein n=1 Tax=Verticillium dahliae TaxID=27337 RepID=A0AA45AK26_VERDA|nr:Putative primary amine oxidase 2 [Verticillium dahliae VDG2]KAH6707392.1 hypothetical protein EV126DRAFT_411576 [Verticillium dahliae]PNH30382.1 hypothetical protein BJF96_g6424 [Verticillium dahliae]PNH56439.1 hypothetical protein VD0003_g1280 [Verticillium dahliae]PNH66776.1 hypothetical protein VD0002_g2681 [Verticillium dahliae]
MSDAIPAEIANANKGPGILAIIIPVSIFSTLFTAARLWVRGKILRQFHADDWLIVVSVICCWISVALAVKAIDNGNGRHLVTLSQEEQEGVVFWTLVGFPLGILSFGIPKLAVVAVLTRIMSPGRTHTIILWTMAGICNVLLALNAVFLLGRCVPAESQWNFDIKGKCWDPQILVRYAIATGVFSAAVDLYLAVYPGLILLNLGIKRNKKIALTVALGLGCISTGVAIFKCTRLPLLAAKDFSWETAELVVLNIVEGGTLIIASCIPVLQPLLRIIMKREPLATSGTPGQEGYNRGASAGQPPKYSDPSYKGPAFMLYPVKSHTRTTHGSADFLVEHGVPIEKN